MDSAEREPVLSSLGAKCFDIGYIENQLGDRLATSAPTPQGMKHDVGSGVGETLQLDDAIALFSVNSETEMACVEFGDGVNVADVEQYSAEDGHWKTRLALLGHRKFTLPGGYGLIGQHCLIGLPGCQTYGAGRRQTKDVQSPRSAGPGDCRLTAAHHRDPVAQCTTFTGCLQIADQSDRTLARFKSGKAAPQTIMDALAKGAVEDRGTGSGIRTLRVHRQGRIGRGRRRRGVRFVGAVADVGVVVSVAGGAILKGEPVKRNEIGAADGLAQERTVRRCGRSWAVGRPISESRCAVPPEEVVKSLAQHVGADSDGRRPLKVPLLEAETDRSACVLQCAQRAGAMHKFVRACGELPEVLDDDGQAFQRHRSGGSCGHAVGQRTWRRHAFCPSMSARTRCAEDRLPRPG